MTASSPQPPTRVEYFGRLQVHQPVHPRNFYTKRAKISGHAETDS